MEFVRNSGIVPFLVNKFLEMISETCDGSLACRICNSLSRFLKNDIIGESAKEHGDKNGLEYPMSFASRRPSEHFREEFFYFAELMREFSLPDLSEKVQPVIKGSLAWNLGQADFYREPKDFDIGIVNMKKEDNAAHVLSMLSERICSLYDCEFVPQKVSDCSVLRCYYPSAFNEETFFDLEMTIMHDRVPIGYIKMLFPLSADILPAFDPSMPPAADAKWLFIDKMFTMEEARRRNDEKKLRQCNADLAHMQRNQSVKKLIEDSSGLEKMIRIRAEEEKAREMNLYESY